MTRIYLDTLDQPTVELRPRPADRPYELKVQGGALRGPQLVAGDLQIHDKTGVKTRLPLSWDDEGRYFFRRCWLPMTYLHGQNPGGLRKLTHALGKYPEAWNQADCPLYPGLPLWEALLRSDHPDRALLPVVDKHWQRLDDTEHQHLLGQALAHHRPLLAEHLWQQGVRLPHDEGLLRQVMQSWVAPSMARWVKHLGVPTWGDERINAYEAIKETTSAFPMFHEKKLVDILGPEGLLPLWGKRLIEAGDHEGLDLPLTFPLTLTYQSAQEPDVKVEMAYSWAAYLLRFGLLAGDSNLPSAPLGATTAIQLQQMAAMGLDYVAVPPPVSPREAPVASWNEYATRHGSWCAEVEACLRDLETPTPDLPSRKRLRA